MLFSHHQGPTAHTELQSPKGSTPEAPEVLFLTSDELHSNVTLMFFRGKKKKKQRKSIFLSDLRNELPPGLFLSHFGVQSWPKLLGCSNF